MAFLLQLNIGSEHTDQLKTSILNSENHEENVVSLDQIEESYRNYTKGENDPIIVLNLDGTIEFIGKAFIEQSGFSTTQLKGKSFYALLNKNDLTDFMTSFGKTIASEEPAMMLGPYKMRNSANKYQFYMGSLYPILKNEKVSKLVMSLKNIDEAIMNGSIDDLNLTRTQLKNIRVSKDK